LFIGREFNNHATECDDSNTPPSLAILRRSLQQLTTQGSDIRGKFVSHRQRGSMAVVAHEIAASAETEAPITPLAAHCLGYGLAQIMKRNDNESGGKKQPTLAVGVDPRDHGFALADAICRGAESAGGVRAVFTGLATTPAMASFCGMDLCQAAVVGR
jgi:hypothetical protein